MTQRERNGRGAAVGISIVCAGLMVVVLAAGLGARGQDDKAAAAAALQAQDDKAKKVYEHICGDCHEIERGFESRRTRYDWEQLVIKMVVEKGAKGTDEEFNLVVTYGLSQAGIVNVNESDVNDVRLALKLTAAEADAIVACRKVGDGIKDFDALKKCANVDGTKLDASKIAIRF